MTEKPLDPWGVRTAVRTRLDRDLLGELATGPLRRFSDVEAALALGGLVHDDLMAFETQGGEMLKDPEMQLALRKEPVSGQQPPR